MSALRQLQRQLSAYVLQGQPAAQDLVVGNAVASAGKRLQVYADAYRLRLLEVLLKELPGTRALLGDADFETLCRDYIEARPSEHFNLRWYGDGLLDFAITHAHWASRPALTDMLGLEANLTGVFDASETKLAVITDLSGIEPSAWPAIRLRTQPALRQRALHWNVAALRLATDREDILPALEQFDGARRWVCWRQDERVRYRELEVDEAALIEALQPGLDFAELCERLLAHHPEAAVPLRAVQLLRRWIDDQWLQTLS